MLRRRIHAEQALCQGAAQGARRILHQHQVSYVVAYDADRVLAASAPLATAPAAPDASMASVLYRTPRSAPPYLRHVFSNPPFNVFTVEEPDRARP